MTQRYVEAVIGQLVTNPGLRRRFADDPVVVLREFLESGFELSAIELEALEGTSADALHTFADALDRRIRRADPASGSDRGR